MKHQESSISDEERLDDRLRALGEVRVDGQLDRSVELLALSLEDEPTRAGAAKESRTARRRRGVRIAVAGIFAALLTGAIAVPTTAVGEWISARTGAFGDPATSTEEDDSEWLNLSGEDLPAVVAEAYPDGLSLPPSMERHDAVAKVDEIMARLGAEPNSIAQEGLITQTYEFWAICAWYDEWLNTDDTARKDVASAWLSDPANFPSTAEHDGGGVVDHMLEVAAAATRGDREAVERGVPSSCDSMLGKDE